MRTSYSALDTYRQCPQKYKFQEIDRIRAPKSKEAIFGTLVHDALKFMFSRDPLYPTLGQVAAYFRENFDAKSMNWQDAEREAYRESALGMLKNFYAKNAPWNFSVVDLESKFEVLIEDPISSETHTLAGKIDRIDKLEDGTFEIIDYKTAKKLPSQEKVDADFQLSLYHLGLQKKWPQLEPSHIKLSLYFLKHGEKLSTARTQEEIELTRQGVLDAIREIAKKLGAAERFEPNPSPLCDWCAFKPICPAWKHLYRSQDPGIKNQEEIDAALKEYFDLVKNNAATEARMAELKQKIREYMERGGYDRVFGEGGFISKSLQKRFAYDFEKVRAILEPLGKWEDILEADDKKLKLVEKQLPPHIRQEIEAARVLIKEFTVLTASQKKVSPG
ncbi:MAG: PD-(D/E)XK nuclease family protein [Candidatus Sungbacteria bacterium]|nr:PD-(D/E)XK nuclease family protein [Candidatus Sungbacteria bacterium]